MFQDGQILGDFEILERLGQGGMGAVYKARQVSLNRLVALKTLQGSLVGDPEYIARFRREATAAASLNHPNLVQVYAAGENDGLHWFAMEYVEGESAQNRVKRKGRLDPAEAIAIVTHVATALDYGWHKAHLIHRDIKPDNIFLSGDGEVKLGDLGLAKSADESQSLTMTGSSMGTPHYVSPEQAQGKKDVDLRADIYSLGCTLFHLVSGEVPFKGDTALAVMMKHVTAPVPHLRSVWPTCPAELARVVTKMMLKAPAARQQSYEEVIADLRRAYDEFTGAAMPHIVAATQQPAAKSPAKRQPPVAKERTPVATIVFGLALLAAIIALFWFAPWKKGDTGGTRPVALPPSPHASGQAGTDGTAPSSAPTKDTASVAAASTEHPSVNSSGAEFAPLFDANGIAGWRQSGSGGEWGYAGGVLSRRMTTKSTARLWCPTNSAPADFEIRFSVRGDRGPAFEFRQDADNVGDHCYRFDPAALKSKGTIFWGGMAKTKVGQRVRVTRDDQREELSKLTELPEWNDGDWNEVVLTVQGNHFSCTCNGALVAEVIDESSAYRAGPGEFGFRVTNNTDGEISAEFKDIRIKRLPAASATTVVAAPPVAAYPHPAKWIDATSDLRSELVADGEWLSATGSYKVLNLTPGQQFQNSIVRVRYSHRVDIALRRTRKGSDDLRYDVGVGPVSVYLSMTQPAGAGSKGIGPWTKLDPSHQPDEEHEAVAAAQGDTLTLWIDGRKIITTQDSTLPSGELAILLKNDAQYGNCRIKKVEYAELPDSAGKPNKPAPPAAVSTPLAVPIDKSWKDVLAAVQVARDFSQKPADNEQTESGTDWKLEGGVLSATKSGLSGVIAPDLILPQSYDLSLRVKAASAQSSTMGVIVPVGGRHLTVLLERNNFESSGLEVIDGKTVPKGGLTTIWPAVLHSNVEQLVEIFVRSHNGDASVALKVDGKPAVDWTGKEASLSLYGTWDYRLKRQHLGLCAHRASVVFKDVRVRGADNVVIPPAVTAPSAPEKWTDWLAGMWRSGTVPHGLVSDGNGYKVAVPKFLTAVGPTMKNEAIRVTGSLKTSKGTQIFLRCVNPNPNPSAKHGYDKTYRLHYDPNGLHLFYRDTSAPSPTEIGGPLTGPIDGNTKHIVELRMVGNVLSVTYDGNILYKTRDTRITAGQPGIYAEAGARFEKIEVLNLDPPAIPPPLLKRYTDTLMHNRDVPTATATDKTAYDAELKRLKSDPTIPATDSPNLPDALKKLRQILRQEVSRQH